MKNADKKSTYRDWIGDELKARQSKLYSYSLRMFAKDLDIGIATLSSVINSKRHLSRKNMEVVAKKLKWSNEQMFSARLEIQANTRRGPGLSSRHVNLASVPHLCSWLHLLILNLTEIQDCPDDLKELAKITNSQEIQLERVILDLQDAALIAKTSQGWQRTDRQLLFGHLHDHPLAGEIREQLNRAIAPSAGNARIVKHAAVALMVSGGEASQSSLLKRVTKVGRMLQKSISKQKEKDTIYAISIEVAPIRTR